MKKPAGIQDKYSHYKTPKNMKIKNNNKPPDKIQKTKPGATTTTFAKAQWATPIIEDKIKLERGAESLFRIASRRHIDLSNTAHNKASLLISINAIIISVVLSVLSTKLETNRHLVLPTVLLIITSVSTIVIALISTRPRIIGGKKADASYQTNEDNILFYGHYLKMTLDEYKEAMRKTILSREMIYDSLSRDIYYQGLVLVWKYKYISISYFVFITGLILSTLAFLFTFIFYNQPA